VPGGQAISISIAQRLRLMHGAPALSSSGAAAQPSAAKADSIMSTAYVEG